jgi:hypothetical protein
MKKQTRKLELRRATLRPLNNASLTNANGGGNWAATCLSDCRCSITDADGQHTCSCNINCHEN